MVAAHVASHRVAALRCCGLLYPGLRGTPSDSERGDRKLVNLFVDAWRRRGLKGLMMLSLAGALYLNCVLQTKTSANTEVPK
jgi:hypothetical protein